jgi:hypothetical protein
MGGLLAAGAWAIAHHGIQYLSANQSEHGKYLHACTFPIVSLNN